MEMGILVKLGLISVISILLLMREENIQVEYFRHQRWSIKEVLRFFWIFMLLYLILIFFYKTNPDNRIYIIISYIFTFLAGSVLLFATKMIIGRRRLSVLKVIGAKNSDLYWIAILISLQYTILLVLFFRGNSVSDPVPTLWMLGYFPVTLIFWPVIESVFYLGMMFIPTSRIVGLLKGAVLISLLQALSHFEYSLSEVVTNFSVFGLLGCYLYIKSERIIVPLLVHSSINFLILMRDI